MFQPTVTIFRLLTLRTPIRKPKSLAKVLNEDKALLYNDVSDVKRFHMCFCFEAINTVTKCIKTQFSQLGYGALKKLSISSKWKLQKMITNNQEILNKKKRECCE